MNVIISLKLKTLGIQRTALLDTLREANKACNRISQIAFENKVYKQFDLHKMAYHPIKKDFNLSSQMIVCQIGKVAGSYQTQRTIKIKFNSLSSIFYDDRIISIKKDSIVSIWTVNGRINIPFICGESREKPLSLEKGRTELIYRRGEFFLNCVFSAKIE